jgi:spore coat polysaccharide biosynthesis protein SpsF (cytidylyltransferase family)
MVPVIIQVRIESLHLLRKSAPLVSRLSILEHIIIRLQQVLEIELFRLTTTRTRTNSPHIEIAKNNLMYPCFAIICLL